MLFIEVTKPNMLFVTSIANGYYKLYLEVLEKVGSVKRSIRIFRFGYKKKPFPHLIAPNRHRIIRITL